jgi:hypothetical protein
MAVGALPVTSTLLREFPTSGPGWHTPLGVLGVAYRNGAWVADNS